MIANMTGAEAWKKGFPKKGTNPYKPGMHEYVIWNDDYDNALADYYAKDFERFGAASHRARADQMDEAARLSGELQDFR